MLKVYKECLCPLRGFTIISVILASGFEITSVHMQMFHLLVTALFEYEYRSDATVGGNFILNSLL